MDVRQWMWTGQYPSVHPRISGIWKQGFHSQSNVSCDSTILLNGSTQLPQHSEDHSTLNMYSIATPPFSVQTTVPWTWLPPDRSDTSEPHGLQHTPAIHLGCAGVSLRCPFQSAWSPAWMEREILIGYNAWRYGWTSLGEHKCSTISTRSFKISFIAMNGSFSSEKIVCNHRNSVQVCESYHHWETLINTPWTLHDHALAIPLNLIITFILSTQNKNTDKI